MMYPDVLSITCIPQSKSTYKAAQTYQRLGLSIIPLKGKRPALSSWRRFQNEAAPADLVEQWHQKRLLDNVGLVCGSVSGGLAVLDFDGAAGYPAFAAKFPELAQTFTVATGSGVGKHVYLFANKVPPTTRALDTPLGHIELRSSGTYVVAPPSTHPDSNKPYTVEKSLDILRVADLRDVVDWIEAFRPPAVEQPQWQPPHRLPAGGPSNGRLLNPRLIEAVAKVLLWRRFKQRGDWLHGSCIYPDRHKHGDRNPSFGFNTRSGYGYCYVCGTLLLKQVCQQLHINPQQHGGLIQQTGPPVVISPVKREGAEAIPPSPPPAPPEEDLPSLSDIRLPDWLRQYVNWASRVGNQTPEIFHLGTGIWMAAVAIARRLHVDARWGIRIYPNLYMMFIADTTFYRKTTAYKLGEQILTAAIPHLLMPTPGSPERFQDALAGQAPGNFDKLPQEQQALVLEAMKFAAQRGLFKDEIGGLFGSFKRDYMAGMKDLLLEVYDCPDFIAKETQSGLAIVRNAAPSILGVTTPAGLSSALSAADWDNGLLPRFVLLAPEPDYKERPTLKEPEKIPDALADGLQQLHQALPMPEKSEHGWQAPQSLGMRFASWEACQDYSNHLRRQCDPRQETPLDDRLKGVYGRMHVQAIKVAMICAALDWTAGDRQDAPAVTEEHWQTGKVIAEHWRLSAHRLLEGLERSGSARSERRMQERVLEAFRHAGPAGLPLRSVYRKLNLKANAARQVTHDLARAGMLRPLSGALAESYAIASPEKSSEGN